MIAAAPGMGAPVEGRATSVGADAKIVVASNRGPVAFSRAEDGGYSMARGGGGLVSGLASVAAEGQTLWVCAALSETDRAVAREAPHGRLHEAGYDTPGPVRMLDIHPTTFSRAYNGVANRTLWFLAHLLFDNASEPVFDPAWFRQWAAYAEYNRAFAEAMAEEAAQGAKVMVQDYHLTLVPGLLRDLRPDVRIAHFSHTPWAPPDYFRMLPDAVAVELLTGMLGADHVGFLAERWADAFLACCAAVLGDRVRVDAAARTVTHTADGRVTRVAVHALGVDGEALLQRGRQQDVAVRETALEELRGDRKMILRIDRTELSKNIVRGLAAYRELLRTHPEWRGRVIHLATAYPSRHDLPEYREYTAAVQRLAGEIDAEFATPDWQPLRLEVSDEYPRSLAAYRIADVLIVNPVRDGMNLVAKEGPILSRDGIALVLSREAGAHAELGEDAITVNPYDVVQTAEALHEALLMDDDERRQRNKRLAAAATQLTPQAWFAEQVAALDA
jgi:trehalose 6-phosphate synthase